MSTSVTTTPEQEARRRRTVAWVVSLAFLGLVFDGYDLVVYGTVLSTFLRDPSQIGAVTPALGGALGSYALVGVLVGALLAGTMSDVLGRRKLMLLSYAWFSVGMAVTALMTTTTGFGLMRFVTGLGVGALVATTGAIVSEFAPPGKKNLCNAIVYSGVPFGSVRALAILLSRRSGGGACSVGALPLSLPWPSSRCRVPPCFPRERSRSPSPPPVSPSQAVPPPPPAFPGLPRRNPPPSGVHDSRPGPVYAINTWLPELMLRAGFNAKGSCPSCWCRTGSSSARWSAPGSRTGSAPLATLPDRRGVIPSHADLPSCALALRGDLGLGTSGTQTLISLWPTTSARTSAARPWRGRRRGRRPPPPLRPPAATPLPCPAQASLRPPPHPRPAVAPPPVQGFRAPPLSPTNRLYPPPNSPPPRPPPPPPSPYPPQSPPSLLPPPTPPPPPGRPHLPPPPRPPPLPVPRAPPHPNLPPPIPPPLRSSSSR